MKQLKMDFHQAEEMNQEGGIKATVTSQSKPAPKLQQQVSQLDNQFVKRNQANRIIENNQNLSYQALKQYLIKKEIPSSIVNELLHVSDTHELYNALHIIGKRYSLIKGKTPYHIQQKMIQYLARKGFSFDIAKRAIEKYLSGVN